MNDPTQSNPDTLRLALDNGDAIELDGGTLTVDGDVTSSVVLRLAGWRARAVARELEDWSVLSRMFSPRALHEFELSRVLATAASVLDPRGPVLQRLRGSRLVSSRRRLAALSELAEREASLSALQRIAVIDAASWWLSDENGGEDLAHALLEASCTTDTTSQHVYLALIGSPGSADPAHEPSGD